ncbi:hypothetical protein Tco_0617369 [Tanacetum coccineum]
MEGSVGHMFFGLKLEKFGRLDQNWYKRQQIRVEVGDKVMLEVSSWKDVVHFGKKEMLAPRYYWTDANLHVHVEEIKVDKTLRFAKEPVEIIDRESCYVAISTLVWVSEVVSSGFPIVKVRRDSERGPKFTWERGDHMKANYQLLNHYDKTLKESLKYFGKIPSGDGEDFFSNEGKKLDDFDR